MRIVLIGAGRLASNLGPALRRAGHVVVGVVSRSLESARVLAERVDAPAFTVSDPFPTNAELYVVSVTDDALPSVVASLPDVGDALVVHTAGSLSMAVFSGSKVRNYGIFYPLQTFTKNVYTDFASIPCFLEANSAHSMQTLRSFAHTLSRDVFDLSSDQRRYLHLAAVFACNFSNHCFAMAEQVLQQQGIPFRVLFPLIDQTAGKVHLISPREGQTGPAVRRDQHILQSQEQLLAPWPELQQIYRVMSESIQRFDNPNFLQND